MRWLFTCLPVKKALQVQTDYQGLVCFNNINTRVSACIMITINHCVAFEWRVCVQTPGCHDARVSSLPHLRVPVHGPEEVPGLHSVWTVHGRNAGEGSLCLLPSNRLIFDLSRKLLYFCIISSWSSVKPPPVIHRFKKEKKKYSLGLP